MSEQQLKPLLSRGTHSNTFHVGKKVAVSGFYEAHDKHQIELKFSFKLSKEDPESNFLVETYLFAPKTLSLFKQLNKATDYFPEITSYVRYGVIALGLDALIDFKNHLSPLMRINQKLDTGECSFCKYDDSKVFNYELRMFTCIFKETIKSKISKYPNFKTMVLEHDRSFYSFVKDLVDFYKSVIAVEKCFGELSDRFVDNKYVSAADLECLDGVKEFFYFELNYFFTELMLRLKEIEARVGEPLVEKEEIHNTYQKLMKMWVNAGYVVLSESSNNKSREKYIYRESKLKKYVSSALFIDREVSSNKSSEEFLYGVAAGLAMLFAGVVAVVTTFYYQMNSIPWLLSAVIAYIIKDRMKVWMQIRFKNILPVYLANRTEKLNDDRAGQVGKLKEWLSFYSFGSLPKDIQYVRRFNRELNGAFRKQEDILCYRKRILLDHEKIRHSHQRVDSIINILRFNVLRFCQQMDDPIKNMKFINEGGEVSYCQGKKVYHLNLVIKVINLKSQTKSDENNKLNLRLILSRDGIERIESPFGLNVSEYFENTWTEGAY